MAPSGWQEMTVEDLKAPIENALATGPFGSSISAKFFQGDGVPVIRGSNLSEDVGARLNDNGLVFVSNEKAAAFKRSVVREGDLIFTCWGTINQVGLIDKRARYHEYVISNKQMKFTPDPRKADSLFLYYLFSGPKMQDEIKNQGIGSSVPGFNLGQLRAKRFLVPPFSEQRVIARILGTLDDKIELNQRMNETLEAVARALFKSWFVDFDPVRAKAEGRDPSLPKAIANLFPDSFEDSEIGEIPKGWKVRRLPDVFDINPARPLRKGQIAPYLDMANMPTRGHVPDQVIDREFGSGMRFINGDTLLARITPCLENGKTAFVDFLPEGQVGWGSTEYIVLRPKPPFPVEFGYCLARSNGFREFAIQSMTGSSGRQRVPAESLAHYLLAEPPAKVAERFGSIIRPMFVKAGEVAQESRCLSELRDSLLQKLVSGELRVKAASRYMDAAGQQPAR